MSGRRLVLGFAAFLAVFAAALVWSQFFAYYERQEGVGALRIDGESVPVADYDGIDATSSPLKLRGCFRIDPAAVAALAPGADATPLNRALLVPLLLGRPPHPRPRLRAPRRPTAIAHDDAAGLRPHARGLPGRPRLHLAPAQREIRGLTMPVVQFPDFMAITCGLVAYLIGEAINNRIPILRRFNIPDPVTGGLLVALVLFALHEFGIVDVCFDTHTRDLLLLIFFTGIGLNARISDLVKGGRPLAILVGLTAVLLIVQNLVGGLAAWAAGLPLGLGRRPRLDLAPRRPRHHHRLVARAQPPAASPAAPRSASPWRPSASWSPRSSAARSAAS